MHRFLFFIACIVLALEISAYAQEDEEEPIPPRRHAQAKIGGAAGFTQHLLFLDLDPINEILRSSRSAAFDKGPLLLLGGQGYGYILVVPNLRVGGLGASGTMKSKSVDPSSNITRGIELSVGFGGVSVEYVLPVVPRLDVALGGMFGGGGMSLKMTRDAGTAVVWDNLWTDFGNNAKSVSEYSRTLSGSFFVYQPSVNVEYAILRWLGVRVGASYLGMAGNSWKLDDSFNVAGVPSNINGKGLMINGGLFLGTFIF